jgi:hypothetical protein
MTDAQRRLLAAFEVVLPYLPDDVCDEKTRDFMALPARIAATAPQHAELEEQRQTRLLGQPDGSDDED